ncbi:hypothetical protein TSUD_283960 [Trifolium subterraneum]|uniref:Uncharacterized protein n=1 Tax=Trifolium subterraneum TaxID=3900 RepID=A0A2Z6PFQ7_TRISU|nr:hypothetical protein TSUD_283960 [Trifolium subterraneum]
MNFTDDHNSFQDDLSHPKPKRRMIDESGAYHELSGMICASSFRNSEMSTGAGNELFVGNNNEVSHLICTTNFEECDIPTNTDDDLSLISNCEGSQVIFTTNLEEHDIPDNYVSDGDDASSSQNSDDQETYASDDEHLNLLTPSGWRMILST